MARSGGLSGIVEKCNGTVAGSRALQAGEKDFEREWHRSFGEDGRE